MLSYKIPEATEPATKLKNADAALHDLEFLREQITVMEANTTTLYNWDGVRRRERRAREAAASTRQQPLLAFFVQSRHWVFLVDGLTQVQ